MPHVALTGPSRRCGRQGAARAANARQAPPLIRRTAQVSYHQGGS